MQENSKENNSESNPTNLREQAMSLPIHRNWIIYIIPTSRDASQPTTPLKLFEIKSIADFWAFMNTFVQHNLVHKGTFYFMQEGYFPDWEHCPEGGRWQFKIPQSWDRNKLWVECCMGLLGEYLVGDNTEGIIGAEIQGFQPIKLRLKLWTKAEKYYPYFHESFVFKDLEKPCYSENKVKDGKFGGPTLSSPKTIKEEKTKKDVEKWQKSPWKTPSEKQRTASNWGYGKSYTSTQPKRIVPNRG